MTQDYSHVYARHVNDPLPSTFMAIQLLGIWSRVHYITKYSHLHITAYHRQADMTLYVCMYVYYVSHMEAYFFFKLVVDRNIVCRHIIMYTDMTAPTISCIQEK